MIVEEIEHFNYLKKIQETIIKKFLREIKNKYIVSIKDKNNREVSDNELLNFNIKKNKRCLGVIQNSSGNLSQCTKNTIYNELDYCKLHCKKYLNKDTDMIWNPNYETDDIIDLNNTFFDNKKYTKKFIEDSFYYIDDRFIYAESGDTVGYIDKNNNEYILTEDPFVLNLIKNEIH